MRIYPKKRLGQNFLVDKNIRKKIIELCEFKPSDIILEIGAGRAELTGLIAERAKKVFALEIDPNLSGIFKENSKGLSNVRLINANILKFDLQKRFKNFKKIKVFGNIPYYISSAIIEHLFEYRGKISEIFITVQKEFAQRLVAHPGSKEYGRLSCFAQYYSEAKILLNIKKGSFFPVPKVDSSFLRLEIKKKLILKKRNEEFLFKIIKAAFGKRRKTLRNSLKGIVSQKILEVFYNTFDLDNNIRPEGLMLTDFINLTFVALQKTSKKGCCILL